MCMMHLRSTQILHSPKQKQMNFYLNLQLYNIALFPSISQLLITFLIDIQGF